MEGLIEAGQKHLFAHWSKSGVDSRKKKRMLKQLLKLDRCTAGGLLGYLERAKALLQASREQRNPLEGFEPDVPEGTNLTIGDSEYLELETAGLPSVGDCAFVLVAGGLGERLGYNGIKIGLPYESLSGKCFMELYAQTILAYENKGRAGRRINLAIMTSDDTHEKTLELLEVSVAAGQKALCFLSRHRPSQHQALFHSLEVCRHGYLMVPLRGK